VDQCNQAGNVPEQCPTFVELGEAGVGQGYHGIGVRVNLPEMMH
jgi:hypothetical protein